MSRHTRIRVAAVIQRANALLLVQHEKDGRRYWLLPGGGVEFGESLEEALLREVREETGLTIRVGALWFAHDTIPPDRHRHILSLVFEAERVSGELAVTPDERLRSAAFMPVADLPNVDLFPDIRTELVDALSAKPAAPAYLGNRWKKV